MALAVCIGAIVVSVAAGWRYKINTGVFATAFAFLAGYFLLGKTVDEVIRFWPVNIVFYLISISLMFNYAVINGTMEMLGKKMLAAFGGRTVLVPWAIAVVCAVVGGFGAGASTPAIVGPFAFTAAGAAGVHPVLTAVCIAFGNLIGSNNPYNGYGGVISRHLIMENGTEAAMAGKISSAVWGNCCVMCLAIIFLFWLVFRNRRRAVEASLGAKAETLSFSPVQKRTALVIIGAFLCMVIPETVCLWFPNRFWETAAGICKPQVVMMIGALICAMMKLAPEREVIRQIPVNTILMISGVYMLIQVAVDAGLIGAISSALSGNVPKALIPGTLVLLAAFLSFFSSSTSTVMPLMYPLVPGLSASFGLSPAALYTCIFFGGLSTAISPFSTGGALTIAGCPEQKVRDELSKKMIFCALIVPVFAAAAAQLGLFSLFG